MSRYKYRALVPRVKAWGKEHGVEYREDTEAQVTSTTSTTSTAYNENRITLIRAATFFCMPWYKYRTLVPRVKAWAKEHGIEYREDTEAQVTNSNNSNRRITLIREPEFFLMPRYKYRALVPRVKAWATEHGVDYREDTEAQVTNSNNSNRRITVIREPEFFLMPRYKYRALVPRVKAWAKEHGVEYREDTEAQVTNSNNSNRCITLIREPEFFLIPRYKYRALS